MSHCVQDPHPRATVLTHGSLAKTLVEDDFQLYWGAVTIQVAGDYVALLVRHVRGRAMSYIDIWNWTQDNSSHQVGAFVHDILFNPDVIFAVRNHGKE